VFIGFWLGDPGKTWA